MFFPDDPPHNNSGNQIITRMEFQDKDPTRRSVFLNDRYAFGISAETYAIFPLREGQVLSDTQIQVIQFHEFYEKARNLALKYLARRMRSKKEVFVYLKRKDIPDIIIDRVIQYCRKRNYVDDLLFTKAFVKDQINQNKAGVFKIRSQLGKKGVTTEIIDSVIDEIVSPDEQLDLAKQLGVKKLKQLKVEKKANKKRKIYRYLIQRGFTYEVVMEVLGSLL